MSILNACLQVESSAQPCIEALESLAAKISNASSIAPTQSNIAEPSQPFTEQFMADDDSVNLLEVLMSMPARAELDHNSNMNLSWLNGSSVASFFEETTF